MEFTINIWHIISSLVLAVIGAYVGAKMKAYTEEQTKEKEHIRASLRELDSLINYVKDQKEKERNHIWRMNYIFKMVNSIDHSLRKINGNHDEWRTKYENGFDKEWKRLNEDPELKHH